MPDIDDPDWPSQIPSDLTPLTPNPGPPGDIVRDMVGREQELAQLQEAVHRGGAHVTGERRMGKTWLLRRLQADLESSVTAIYVSAETSDMTVFAGRLLSALRENQAVSEKVSRWEKSVKGEATLNLGIVKLAVTGEATKAASGAPEALDVLDLLRSPRTGPVVLIIDEITDLCKHLGPHDATEFLSGLRARRESGAQPLVISGSIGIHHAIKDMTPLSGLTTVNVGPLAEPDAAVLAARLLLSIRISPTPQLVDDIVQQTSGIPYYIQHVVNEWRSHPDLNVPELVEYCLAHRLWEIDHYDTRMPDYYGADAPRARAILDFVSEFDDQMTVDVNTISTRMKTDYSDLAGSRDQLIALLDDLVKDHYLIRERNAVRFSSPLLRRIWRRIRWLS